MNAHTPPKTKITTTKTVGARGDILAIQTGCGPGQLESKAPLTNLSHGGGRNGDAEIPNPGSLKIGPSLFPFLSMRIIFEACVFKN